MRVQGVFNGGFGICDLGYFLNIYLTFTSFGNAIHGVFQGFVLFNLLQKQ